MSSDKSTVSNYRPSLAYCFLLFFVVMEKRSGDLTIEFLCNKIDRLCQALIAGDKPKRGTKDLCGYVSYYTSGMYNSLRKHTSS